jgi:hypothetical protein
MDREIIHGEPVSTTSTCGMAVTLRHVRARDTKRSFILHSAWHHDRVTTVPYRGGVLDPIPEPAHQVSISRTGRFMLPTCTCGWIGTARLTEAAAREEARDHALLYADSDISVEQIRVLASADPAEPDPDE